MNAIAKPNSKMENLVSSNMAGQKCSKMEGKHFQRVFIAIHSYFMPKNSHMWAAATTGWS